MANTQKTFIPFDVNDDKWAIKVNHYTVLKLCI